MLEINFDAIKANVLRRLEAGLSPKLYYHGIHHTRDDVLPAAIQLGEYSKVSDDEMLLLKTAAVYHDIGYIESYKDHEATGARIAAEELPELGYPPQEVQKIVNMIMATRMPQAPRTVLEKLMCDADLNSLGREDFFITSHQLRLELMEMGIQVQVRDWYVRQLKFLQSQSYWSEAAQALSEPGKQKIIIELKTILAID